MSRSDDTGATLAAFAAINLTELERVAALQRRVDRKYLLTSAECRRFLDRLGRDTRVLEIDGRRGFRYESTYHDSSDLVSYRLAATGRPRRFKVRRRCYTDSGLSFWEVKTRRAGVTIKDRLPLTGATTRREIDSFTAAALASAGMEYCGVGALRPCLEVGYRRHTLLTDDLSRVTIDEDLNWSLPSGRAPIARPRDLVVVETKSDTGHTPSDRLLWRLGHRPARLSKYATALAAIHPGLNSNRWNRTLRRHPLTITTDPARALALAP